MINEYAHISIVQKGDNNYTIKLTGSSKYILKGLAAAVAQTINSLPEDYQQENRIIFLQYLNKATTQIQEE